MPEVGWLVFKARRLVYHSSLEAHRLVYHSTLEAHRLVYHSTLKAHITQLLRLMYH